MSLDQDLASVRSQIDAIDDAIHDLIIRRTELVEQVRMIKHDLPVKIQPSREAEIVYRIVSQHRGPFPKPELVAIWRQMINATLSFEGPFSVAVYMPETDGSYWDLARDQYGAYTPMRSHRSARSVIEAVRHHEAIVGVLPLPRPDDPDPWWRYLVATQPETPRIIARLPFAGPASTRGGEAEALVICPVALRPTGRDRTYLAAEVEAETTDGQLATALGKVGLPPVFTALWRDAERPSSSLYLCEVAAYVEAGDPRLDDVSADVGLNRNRIVVLGGYAEPLGPDDLGPSQRQASATPLAQGVNVTAS